MYEKHYGFAKMPFSISPDPAFLYLNENYREATAVLQYAIRDQQGIVSLIGEVGTGKTMLLNALLEALPVPSQVAKIPPSRFEFEELVSFVLDKLEPAGSPHNSKLAFDQLLNLLLAKTAAGERVVLLVDEAQDLDAESLESVRLLSNFETPSEKLLQILLVGQPELRRKLNMPELRQLKQRIAVTYEIALLNPAEVPSYIAHRLTTAGYRNGHSLFTSDAIGLIAQVSKGIPRLVNALCHNALLTGFAANKHWIDRAMVQEAAKDLMLDYPAEERADRNDRRQEIATPITSPAVPPQPASTQSTAERSPMGVVTVIALLALLLAGLFAEPLLRALPADWGERIAMLFGSPQGTDTVVDSPADLTDNKAESRPETKLGEPTAGLAAAITSKVAEPAIQPKPEPETGTGTGETGATTESTLVTTASHNAEPTPRTGFREPTAEPAAAVTSKVAEPETQPKPESEPELETGTTTENTLVTAASARLDGQGSNGTSPPQELSRAPRPQQVGLAEQAANKPAAASSSASAAFENVATPTPVAPNRRPADDRDQRPTPSEPAAETPTFGAAPRLVGPEPDAETRVNLRRGDEQGPDVRGRPTVIELAEQQPRPMAPLARSTAGGVAALEMPPSAVVTINPGDTISQLARQTYGEADLYVLAAIRMANPDIGNLDVVDFGREVVMPRLSQGLVVAAEPDGGARVLLGAAPTLAQAGALKALYRRNGVSTEIISDKLSNTITAYRLETRFSPDGPPTAEALDKLSTLRLKFADYRE